MSAIGMFDRGRRVARHLERILESVDHPVARTLIRRRALGSGLDGAWTRQDHRRVLALGIGAQVASWVLAMGIFALADRAPLQSQWNAVLSGVGLFCFFGGGYLGWQGVKHVRSAFRRDGAGAAI